MDGIASANAVETKKEKRNKEGRIFCQRKFVKNVKEKCRMLIFIPIKMVKNFSYVNLV
jgi:hypothetical protein